jgi:hypothetical protein
MAMKGGGIKSGLNVVLKQCIDILRLILPLKMRTSKIIGKLLGNERTNGLG